MPHVTFTTPQRPTTSATSLTLGAFELDVSGAITIPRTKESGINTKLGLLVLVY